MVTNDIMPTSGTAYLLGRDILEDQSHVRRLIGYCPQFEALLDLLTAREHLELYARLKCIPEPLIPQMVKDKLDELNLTDFADKLAGTLSGGNKRRLSLAVAMIGDPPIMFLDEISSGVDPGGRRVLWEGITRALDRGCAIVLTTHSMEEAEALCGRISIMVGGSLTCLGGSQHLKSRFGAGYMVELDMMHPDDASVDALAAKLGQALGLRGGFRIVPGDALANGAASDTGAEAPSLASDVASLTIKQAARALGDEPRVALVTAREDSAYPVWRAFDVDGFMEVREFAAWWLLQSSSNRVDDFMHASFKGAALMERHDMHLRYSVPDVSKGVGFIFEAIEEKKNELGVAEYSCSQTSLEAIFNSFAAAQDEEQGAVRGIRKLLRSTSRLSSHG